MLLEEEGRGWVSGIGVVYGFEACGEQAWAANAVEVFGYEGGAGMGLDTFFMEWAYPGVGLTEPREFSCVVCVVGGGGGRRWW